LAKLFGFNFSRVESSYLKQDKVANDNVSFIDREADSTAAVVMATPFSTGTFVDLTGNIKTEAEFISKYREMMNQPEIDNAVSEIVNESVCTDKDFVIKIDLDDVPLEEQAKIVIKEQFDEIVNLLDFNVMAYDIFKRWYVDGRLYYHAVIDPKRPFEGIKEFRYIDPRKIREIKEVQQQPIAGGVAHQSAEVTITKNDYYLYNEKGFTNTGKTAGNQNPSTGGIRISKDSVIHVPSGLTDVNGTVGLSHLHKAIKILNELRTIEDAIIIYRLARAPERRVWKVDCGTLPPMKARQHLQEMMNLQKNRLIYDADSGTVRDDRKFMTMMEDYWMPTWADGRGTTVDILQGGQNLGNIEDVVYFQKQLYNSLNVPIDRLQEDTPFSGNMQEISRAEIKFNKFITRLRQQFSTLFTKCLERHCVLKGLMSIEEFKMIEKDIDYEFANDDHFSNLVDQQVISSQINTYILIEQAGLVGKYYSNRWIRRNIFKQTEEDIIQMTQEIMEEMQDPLYAPQPEEGGGGATESGGEDGGGGAPVEASHASESGSHLEKSNKIENAKHVVNALVNVKKKSPEDEKKLKSAAQILAKNT